MRTACSAKRSAAGQFPNTLAEAMDMNAFRPRLSSENGLKVQ